MTIPWDELRLSQVEAGAKGCPDACSVDVESLVAEVRRLQALTEMTQFCLSQARIVLRHFKVMLPSSDDRRIAEGAMIASEPPEQLSGMVNRFEQIDTQNRDYRSLLECAEFALDWLTLHHVIEDGGKDWKSKFDGSAFYDCDCSESGGYLEHDTNAYIHTETCASGFEDSLAALHDQIKQALGKN